MNNKGGRRNFKKRKYSFERKENPLKTHANNKILMVRKLNIDEKNNTEINKEINEYFGCPDKYFQKNSPVTIGKKITLFDMNDNRMRRIKKLKTEKKNGLSLFNHLTGISSTLKSKNGTSLLSNLLNNDKGKNNFQSKFEVIDNNKLKYIFDSYKIINHQPALDNSTEKNQSIKSENPLMQNCYEQRRNLFGKSKINFNLNNQKKEEPIPEIIKKCLNLQTRKLNLMKSSELKNLKMSKYLSRKANKPQDNLLLNRIDTFRYKKEVINEIEYNKPVEDEQYWKYQWNMSLRRPKYFRGARKLFVNLSEEKYLPLWSLIIEKSPKVKDLSVKPDYILSEGEIHEFQKQANNLKRYNVEENNTNPYFQTVENLDKLIVKGRNLYNLEYKREILDNKNNKIWHKIFMENGKATFLGDINKIYGNETFYKNYDVSDTKKTIQRNIGSYNFTDFQKTTI